MTKDKKIQLGYRISKIQTTKFSFEDIETNDSENLFGMDNELIINVKIGLNIEKEKSSITLDIMSELYKKDKIEKLVEHSGRTVFFVNGLEKTFNKEKNTFDLPDEFLAQIYGIAYTHARALLAIEVSPTIFRDKYFLPVVNPLDLIKFNN